MVQDYLIIGTDVGVGKTHVTCALLRDLRRRGFNAMGYKPICCGDRSEARAIREATDPSISLELINPLYLRANADPYIAAELQRVTIEPDMLVEGYRKLKEAGYAPIIIEGIGGPETPIAPHYTMSALAEALGLSVLLVAANRQGAAGQVIMAEQALQDQCCGVILNHIGEEWDTAAVTNRQAIEAFSSLPVLAELIDGQKDIDSESILKEVEEPSLGPGLSALLAAKKPQS